MDKRETNAGISRRGFLKTAAAVAGVGAAASPAMSALAADGKAASGKDEVLPGACALNCQNNCALNIHVRDGKVVKTSMRPFPDPAYNRICLRGLSHVGRMYNDRRLKYPLKRAGERGEGKWERISWDDALNEIADTINKTVKTYGAKAVALMTGSGNEGLIHGNCGIIIKFFQDLGATYIGRSCDMAVINGLLRVAYPYQNPDAKDWMNSDVLLIWASSLTESNLQAWHFAAEAQENGTRILCVDSQFCTTAAKADLWIHPRPGSDAAFAMGAIRKLIEGGYIVEDFVKQRTNAPFLIREDTKQYLYGGAADPEAGEDVASLPLVWDEVAGAPAPAAMCTTPALEGTFTVNGIRVSTAFTLLKKACEKYTDDFVEEITGVTGAEVDAFVKMYGSAGKAHLLIGYGTDHYYHGQVPAHGAAVMQLLCDNLEGDGGGMGTYPGYQFDYDRSLIGPMYAEPTDFLHSQLAEVMESGSFLGKPYPIKVLWNASGNPVSDYCDSNKWLKTILPKVDLFVCTEITETDTTDLADIVLPVCHWFECFDVAGKCGAPYIFYREKAAEPQFESKSEADILRALAPKVGIANIWGNDDKELAREIFKRSTAIVGSGSKSAFDEMIETGFVAVTPAKAYPGAPVYSASGRYDLYHDTPYPFYATDKDVATHWDYLPTWEPQNEIDNAELRKKYPFSVMNSHPRWRVHSSFYEVPWLQEIAGEPIVQMNPKDAAAKGLSDGDIVRVFNDRGEVGLKLVLSEGIQPGSLDIPKGAQKNQTRFGQYNAISTAVYNPIQTQQAWFDTLVDVEKA